MLRTPIQGMPQADAPSPTWREQLAWAAGFFDGEGCVTSSEARSRRPMMFITQHDPRVLRRFRQVVGFGKVYGPYRSGSRRAHRGSKSVFERLLRKPAVYVPTFRWVWKTNGGYQDVEAIARMLSPWLGVRKKQDARRVLRAAPKPDRHLRYSGESFKALLRLTE